MSHVDLYSDGSSRGNPGPGGYGCILVAKTPSGTLHEKEMSCGYIETTNNRMELMGVIVGFEALRRPCEVNVVTDSQYVVNAINKGWLSGWKAKGWKGAGNKKVKNVDLWKRLISAMEGHSATFSWVKGHAGHPYNERCDELATMAADGDNLVADEGFFAEEGLGI